MLKYIKRSDRKGEGGEGEGEVKGWRREGDREGEGEMREKQGQERSNQHIRTKT